MQTFIPTQKYICIVDRSHCTLGKQVHRQMHIQIYYALQIFTDINPMHRYKWTDSDVNVKI